MALSSPVFFVISKTNIIFDILKGKMTTESWSEKENLPRVIKGPVIWRVFFGFQVLEKIPPRFPRSFSP